MNRNRMIRWPLALFALLLFVSSPLRADPPTKPGIIFVVGGVGGLDFLSFVSHWALPKAGVPHEIHNFVWTHGKGHYLLDLQDTRHCLSKAQELADLVQESRRTHPDRPVYLLGRSGGAGLTLAAAELLPERSVERIVLLSAAVAPTYDLRPALRATNYGVISFYSRLDKVVLGWGTMQFGTIDRFYGPSAGLTGFKIPTGLSAEDRFLYARLVQLPWHPGLLREGNSGGHLGSTMPGFIAKEVAPWLKP